jgi:valyl-tRNA synthetase
MDFERLPNGQASSPSTFSLEFSRFLRKLFYQLVQDDVIYEAEDIVYRNTKYQTSLGRDEVRFEKQKGKKYTIKYFISTKNNSINVITTSPETIFGDVALAVHPDNKRYHNLIGQKAIIPIVNKTIPIIADERVDMFANN